MNNYQKSIVTQLTFVKMRQTKKISPLKSHFNPSK